DNRSTEQARRVAERGAEIYDHTARWPDIFFPAVRLLWLKDNRPADFAQVTRILMVNEYFIYRLTGRMCSEWTNAAETLLFDTGRLAWSDWLPGFFDMGRIKPNDLIAPGDIADNLRPDLASRLGLGHIPVVAAVSDTQAATLGSGMIRPGDVVAVNGSTTPVLMVEDHFLLDPERRIWVDPYIRNLWLLESNCLSSGMVHRKLMDHLTELIRLLPGQEGFGRPELYALLDKLEDRTEGVIASFGPRRFHVSRRCGQERCEVSFPNEQTNIFAAILPAYVENLAFAIVSNVEQLEVISGRRVERFCLTGGGSRSRHLRRLIPLLLPGRQIKVTRDLETTSRGAAMQALATVGVYADVQSAIAGMTGEDWYEEVSQEQDVPGLAERHRAWRERYD
ncbi:MAG: FGGY-family carbohydrate kinase, partial [Planctomycetota bacterium]|nr:FGGY-family carbohydrate kinase [Planctomycetota bacterium]